MESTMTVVPAESTEAVPVETPDFLDLVTLEPLGDRIEFSIHPDPSY